MNNIIETHIIPEGMAGSRLDRYACEVFDILPSRKSARKAIKRGDIRVNGEIHEPHYRVSSGQHLELIQEKKSTPKPFPLQLKILYEDDWLAVVEKPPGFAVNGNQYKTIENALLFNLNPSKESDALMWPRPVHRLDSSTGGLLAAAKTAKAQVHLGRQFHDRKVYKRYRTIVIGRLEGHGCIKKPLDERDAETIFQSVEHVPSLRNGWLTLVDLWPKTGRTHQLRRHLSDFGFPVLGDKLYGIPGEILKSKGLFLWAVELSFKHPIKGMPLTVKIKEADKFTSFLRREERRWKRYQ